MRVPRATSVAVPAFLGVLALLLASACSGKAPSAAASDAKPEKTTLVVGATPAEAVSALYVAAQQGIFAAHGLKVEIKAISSTGSATVLPDLLNGTYDVAAGQLTTFISAQAKGEGPFRVLAGGLEIGPAVNELMAEPGTISDPADLAGKTIAVNASTGNGVLLTDALLATYGIQPSQVTYKVIPFAGMGAALQSGAVAAAYETEPYVTELEQQLGATPVADLDQGSAEGIMVGGFTVTTAWAAKYPRTAAAFTAAIDQASEVADSNITALERAFQVYLDVSPQISDVLATGTFPTSLSIPKLQQVADLMAEFHELPGASFNVGPMVRAK